MQEKEMVSRRFCDSLESAARSARGKRPRRRASRPASLAVLAFLLLASACLANTGFSRQAADQKPRTKPAGWVLLRIVSVEKTPEGKWRAQLGSGRANGLAENAKGSFYLYLPREKKGNGVRLVGEAHLVSLEDASAAAEITLNPGVEDSPAAGDFVELPFTVPSDVFEGQILALAKIHINFNSPDGATHFTDMPAALAIHSQAEENAVLEKIAALIRATPPKPPKEGAQPEVVDKGFFHGKPLVAVLQNCSAADVSDLFSFMKENASSFAGNSYGTPDLFSRWVMVGALESRESLERRAATFTDEAALTAYVKDVQERTQLVAGSLFLWADASEKEAYAGNASGLQAYGRLMRAAAAATSTPAFRVAAQLSEAILLARGKLSDGIARLRETAALADTLPDDDSYDTPQNTRDDLTRTYWKSQCLYELGRMQTRVPDDPAAIASFDEALKLFAGHAHSGVRIAWMSLVLLQDAHANQRAGKLDRAAELYLQVREAASHRTDSSGHDLEAQAVAGLGDIAAVRRDYKLAISRLAEAADLASKYALTGRFTEISWKLALQRWNIGEYDEASAIFEQILPYFRAQDETVDVCSLLQNIAVLSGYLDRYDKAFATFAEGRRLAEAHQLPLSAVTLDRFEAELLSRLGRYAESEKLFAAAIARLDPAKNPEDLARVYSATAAMFAKARQLDKAAENYNKAADLYSKVGKRDAQDEQLAALADVYRQSGKSTEAQATLLQVIAHQRAAGGAPLARSLTSLAFLYLYSPGGLPRAIAAANEAFDAASASGEPEVIAGAHEARAAYYERTGDEAKARAEFQSAIRDSQAHKDEFRVAYYNWRLGMIAANLEDHAVARQSYETALAYFREKKMTYWAAEVLLSSGYLRAWEGDLDGARADLQAARATGEKALAVQAEAWVLEGRIARSIEENQDAIAAFRRADEIWKQTANSAGRLAVLLEIEGIQHDQRELEDAKRTCEEMIGLSQDNPYMLTLAWGNLSLVLLRLGQFQEADVAAKKSMELADAMQQIPYLAAELRGAWAVHLLEEARKIDDLSAAARVTDDATRYLNESEALARKNNIPRTILRVQFGQGRRLLLLADRPGLEALVKVQPNPPPAGEPNPLDATIAGANKLRLLEYQWEGLYNRGALCAHGADYDCAVRDLEASLVFLEKQATQYAVMGSGGAGSASRYQADKQRPFLVLLKVYQDRSVEREKAAANAARKGFQDDAAAARKEAQEATARARDTLDRLRRYEMQTASPGIKLSADSGQQGLAVTAYRNLIRQEKELERRLDEENKHEPPRDGVIKTIEDELTQKRTQVDKEAQLIREQFPALASDLELDPENPDAFVKALREDEALVEPVLTADRLIIFVARNHQDEVSVWSFTAEVDAKKFESDLTALWKAASDPGSSFDPAASAEPGTPAHVAAELYDWLFASAELRLEGVKTVLLSATGPLRYVPFHILLAPGSGGQRVYLNDRYNIVYLTRKGIASGYAPGAKYDKAAVVAIANPSKEEPLPEADAEVGAMAEIWKGAAAPFEIRQHDQATAGGVSTLLQRMKAQTPGAQRILHIATHGSAGSLPQESYLLFADGKVPQDELREKLGLGRAGVSLAVLSGCETAYKSGALGQGVPGAPGEFDGLGVTGLAYGFENAGVKTVLGTLWKLDSATGPVFMQGFYRRLAAGDSVAEALSRTREELRKSKPHPYYWAPFIVVGQWR